MLCEKLPETKEEIIEQLKKNKVSGLKDTAIFMTAVGQHGQWNEQKATKEYMLRIRPFVIEILNELKAKEQ